MEKFGGATLRFFAEYADLTSYWWTGHPVERNISYGHHIYKDGYRYRGRPIGHWADQDSQIISIGGILQRMDGIGWGSILRTGKLNEDGTGRNSVSDNTTNDYFALDVFNAREYPEYGLSVHTSLGWESFQPSVSPSNNGLAGYLSITRSF